jgi:hypothetical protein
MNKIATLFTAGLMSFGTPTKAVTNLAETAIKHTPINIMADTAKATDVFTQLKPASICDEVKTFRDCECKDGIDSGDTFTCFASKDGVNYYTDPKFTTETYAVQDGLKTTFQTCPDKAIPTKAFSVSPADKAVQPEVAKAAVSEFTESYPAVQEHVVEKGNTIYNMAKELTTVNGQKPNKELTMKVAKQILLMNGMTMEDAKALKANSIIKLPTAKSIVKE